MIYRTENNVPRILELLQKIKDCENLEFGELKELLERAYHLLKNNSDNYSNYNIGLSVICHVASSGLKDPLLKKLLHDCIVQSRVFLYDDMIPQDQKQSSSFELSIYDKFAKEYYTLENSDTVLTRDQKELFDLFQKKRRVVVSAPTSFGKSRMVQEIVVHNDYKNILIVLPTIALLNETFVKFKNNPLLSKYQLYNSLGTKKVEFRKEYNIFIFTPEKTDLLLDQGLNLRFDFFIMDEIYKIQDGDERSKIFTNCLYRLSNIPKIDFYLIGPYFSGFSRNFLKKTNSQFVIYESEIVQKDDFDVSKLNPGDRFQVNGSKLKVYKGIKTNLRNIFKALEGQSLIYRGNRKYSAESLAKFLIPHNDRNSNIELINYIEENVAPDWTLVNCLKAGIAFHHGALPKYIQTEIIEAFNDGKLDAIVCTSTIVEGVNTTAKNVIIYDQYKGINELTGFDVKNIKGRAGRFLVHFIGNIYSLIPLSEEENKGEIEFSYFDRDDLDPEDTIQMNINDLSGNNLKNRKSMEEELRRLSIPIEIIRSNKFIHIHKQISLITELRNDISLLNNLYFTGSLPLKEQLDTILNLCYEYLFNKRDAENRNYTIGQLIRLTKYYVYKKPSLKELIAIHDKTNNIDTRIRNAFNLISHFFEFAIPKYLTAFENIYNFVYKEKGKGDKGISLTYLITLLEFGHSEDHEIALKEAGVPNEIIRKISNQFTDCSTIEQIRIKYNLNPNLTKFLNAFEQKIFKRYV